ncbi:DUF6343 family protein [Streptomyces sp. RFCAC02]|uniref:DUF6343 family protein n=1 Tax=Streptomyces sp. RFCAC02 TaxID=2499143 RepID=UPI00101FA839|nr:DUF6343 family protein [Streptomyces sp. RFCAC02]
MRDRGRRTGTEPVTAQSDLGLRLILSWIFVPLFLAATVLFAVWWGAADDDNTPNPTQLGWLTLVCALLTIVAVIDLLVVSRLRARRRALHRRGRGM